MAARYGNQLASIAGARAILRADLLMYLTIQHANTPSSQCDLFMTLSRPRTISTDPHPRLAHMIEGQGLRVEGQCRAGHVGISKSRVEVVHTHVEISRSEGRGSRVEGREAQDPQVYNGWMFWAGRKVQVRLKSSSPGQQVEGIKCMLLGCERLPEPYYYNPVERVSQFERYRP